MVQINFSQVNANAETGVVFNGEFVLNLDKIKYKIKIDILSKPTSKNMHTRIKTISEETKNKNKNQTVSRWREVLKFFGKYLFFIEEKYIKEYKNSSLEKFSIDIDTEKQFAIIPDNVVLDKNDIEIILKNSKNKNKLYNLSNIKMLEDFKKEWERGIKNNEKEAYFGKKLKEFKKIIPLLFSNINYNFSLDVEKTLILTNHDSGNRADIVIDNKTLIELKRPSTKLFNKKTSRNNMVNISYELVSAAVQLSLYNKRMSQKAEGIEKSFIYSILIIGKNEEINDSKKKKNSWNIFKENFRWKIYTFTDITDKINKLLVFFQKES